MNQAQIEEIFKIFSKNNPTPKTELEFTNNFTLVVAVVLSAQATDVSVNKATGKLFAKYDTPEKMLALGEDGLKEYIRTIGLFNSKARNIIALCRDLIEKHNSGIPADFETLASLPGVGRKTANVILNCAFGHKTMAVDTHVFRVSNRLGLTKGKTPIAVEKDLLENIPESWLQHAHHWLILHGRYVCKARKPLCEICSINNYCDYHLELNAARIQSTRKNTA